jgi:hypothetical protein
MTGPTLESLAIPIPKMDTPDKDASIPDAPSDMTPDFGGARKRRRRPEPRKPEPPTPASVQAVDVATPLTPTEVAQIGKALGVGLRVIFAMIAAKRGQHWQLAETDEQMLGAVWADALAPWLVTNAKYVPLAVATLATVGVVVPRIDADAKALPKEVTKPVAQPGSGDA